MADLSRILSIDIGEVYAYATAFSDTEPQRLVKTERFLKYVSDDQLIAEIESHFETKADQVHFLHDRPEGWLTKSLRWVSPDGVAVGIVLDSGQTHVTVTSFGRLVREFTIPFGWGLGINDVMNQGGNRYVQEWLKISSHEQDHARAMNFLGRRTIYPQLKPEHEVHTHALVGVIRFIFKQIAVEHGLTGKYGSNLISGGRNRIVLSGELLGSIDQVGEVLLAVMDEIQLEGVWEIIWDENRVLPGVGLLRHFPGQPVEDSGMNLMATLLTLSHRYPWEMALGELEVDAGLSENLQLQLRSGDIVRFPFVQEVPGALSLQVVNDVKILGYTGEHKIQGGVFGLIVDVRGRPLPEVTTPGFYKKHYRHWHEALVKSL